MSQRLWRQVRGQQTARLVAEYLQPIAPGAEATPSAYAGTDIKGVSWDVEVKAPREETWKHNEAGADHPPVPTPVLCDDCSGILTHARFSLRAALRQAAKRRKPDHVLPPMVVLRPDGAGDASVGEFIVARFLADDREILAELLDLRRLFHHLARVYRRDVLEYTDKAGGLMSVAARAELEALRAEDP